MNKRILSLLLTVAMLLTALVMVVPASAATEPLPLKTKGYLLRVHSSSTANGMSIVYLLSDGTFVVFDGGGSDTDAKHLNEQLRSIADEHGIEQIVVSLWVITHNHGDHVGFLSYWSSYASNITVKEIWYNHRGNGTNAGTSLKNYYRSATVKSVYAGETYQFADMKIKVLWSADTRSSSSGYNYKYFSATTDNNNCTTLYPDYTDPDDLLVYNAPGPDVNNSSYILRLDIQEDSILMTGDAGWAALETVYNNYRADMDVDILQIPHHGVGESTADNKYGTINNKHMSAITPSKIILPAGLNVVNPSLSGGRAYNINDVVQSWNNGSTEKDYDGVYKIYMDFGIVTAAGGEGRTFASEAKFTEKQHGYSADGTKEYFMAGWLNPNDYEGTKGKQMFFEAPDPIDLTLTTEMLAGAAVRCVPDGASGLRFVSIVPKATVENAENALSKGALKSYSFGTVIFKASSLSKLDGDISVAALEAAGEQYVDIEAKNGIRDNTDGSKTISAALVNIKEKNYSLAFAAVSYIEYRLANGEVVRTYSAFDAQNNVRSIAQVAKAALADVSDVQKTEKVDGMYYSYSHLITDPADKYYGKYSLYTAEQRAVLQNYVRTNDDTLAGYDGDDLGYDIWS